MSLSNDAQSTEHFCTLFDSNFLPMGLSLHASLMKHSQSSHLWILCMDKLVEQQLRKINLPHVSLIPLASIETEELLIVKAQRSRGEYCWTLTPFIFTKVFEASSSVQRLTYLDADLFFFRDPKVLINELQESGRDVLITEHAYDPKYDQSLIAGKFCVQFLTFTRTNSSEKILNWWQKKCLDWCFSRYEDGKFGDQKYLDLWPQLFPDSIWILQQKDNTMAPWNVKYFYRYLSDTHRPVFFHFHGLRVIEKDRLLLYISYPVDSKGMSLYKAYINQIRESLLTLKKNQISIPVMPFSRKKYDLSWLQIFKLYILRYIQFQKIEL
jgi:hypothetical protein